MNPLLVIFLALTGWTLLAFGFAAVLGRFLRDLEGDDWMRCRYPDCVRRGSLYVWQDPRTFDGQLVSSHFCPAHGSRLGAEPMDRETA